MAEPQINHDYQRLTMILFRVWRNSYTFGAILSFASEYSIDIPYDGQLIGNRRVDFIVENVVSVELKAVSKLEKVHLAQALNYLAFELKIGLLINFGEKTLVFKRLINNKNSNHG